MKENDFNNSNLNDEIDSDENSDDVEEVENGLANLYSKIRKSEENFRSFKKRPRTLILKDYRPMLSDYLYNIEKIKNKCDRITKKECHTFNHQARKKNRDIFYGSLHDAIKYYMKKFHVEKDDLRVLLGTNLNELDLLLNCDKNEYTLNFKLVYDVCHVLGISITEIVEKMEGNFTACCDG